MKNNSIHSLLFILLLLVYSCSKQKITIDPVYSTTTTGFNLKWRNLPSLSNQQMLDNINLLKPKILRYPGGSIAHEWNWRTGLPVNPVATDIIHPITDVALLQQKTGVDILFVLDVVHSTAEDQIAMMRAANVPVKYIELGNELYSDEYVTSFATGKEYADTVNSWVPKIRAAFPTAKISAFLIGKPANANTRPRQFNWNGLVTSNITAPLQAYSYHIYVDTMETVAERIQRFEVVFVRNSNKEVWVTEYSSYDGNISKILALADYIDPVADISLNHTLYTPTGSFSKLTADGNSLTAEGQAYVSRANR